MFFIVKLYYVFDLGATRFNHRRGFRTVASATLPAARAQLNEEHVSFAWPLALKRSALLTLTLALPLTLTLTTGALLLTLTTGALLLTLTTGARSAA